MGLNYVDPHIHIQSLDSASTPKDFVKRELELGTGAVCVTDHGFLGAVPEVYALAKKNGLIPIVGLEAYVRDDNCQILTAAGIKKNDKGTLADYTKYMHLTMHCQDQVAYQALVKELSWSAMNRAEAHGSERKPLFDWQQLERLGGYNMTFLSSCLIGVVQRHLMLEQPDIAVKYYEKVRSLVRTGNFFVELFPHKCSHYWQQAVFLKTLDGTERKFTQSKWLAIKSPFFESQSHEIRASDLAKVFDKIATKGPVELLSVKHYHKWEDQEPVVITGVREVEDFVENECRPWTGGSTDYQLATNKFMLELAAKYGDKVLVSGDSHFAYPEAKLVQDAKLTQGNHKWLMSTSYHRQSGDEARQHFKDTLGASDKQIDEWIDNSYYFRDKFKDFKFDIKTQLVTKRYPENTLVHLNTLIKKHGRMDFGNQGMVDRLKTEVKLLHKNGTIDLLPYFFLAEEVIDAYTQAKRLTGSGRGSSAGCLVDYLLGITHLNPLEYDLSLDRFLTLDRIKSGHLPDIDIDLPSPAFLLNQTDGWLKKNFGDRAAAIGTKTGLRLKSSIKDVMRARDFQEHKKRAPDDLKYKGWVPPEVEVLCMRLPHPPQGLSNDLDWVFGYVADDGKEVRGLIEESEELKDFSEKYPAEWKTIIGMLGIHRSLSRHASGVILADVPISDFIPIYDSSGYPTTQYDMVGVEAMGGLKMDFLSLSTLCWLEQAIGLVQLRHGGGHRTEPMTIKGIRVWGHQQIIDKSGSWHSVWNLPYDRQVYRNICEGKNQTVFQISTDGALQWMREFNHVVDEKSGAKAIDSITGLANFISLNRPGPLDAHVDGPDGKKYNMLQEYARRARGLDPIGEVKTLTELLPETLGVLVTQEGLEKVYRYLTGCSGAEATEFRSNVAKKKMEKVEKAFGPFMERASQKIGETEARQVWDSVVTFGRYGFNSSHAHSYSIISYACAWLKYNYPLEWWCAVLRIESKDKLFEEHWQHCKQLVLMPDIRYSKSEFSIEGDKLRMPLSFIHGLGEATHAELVAGLPYADIRDFCTKIYERRRANSKPAFETDKVTPKIDKKSGKQKMTLGRSTIHSGIIKKLVLSGIIDSLYPPDTSLSTKFRLYQEITTELNNQGKNKAPPQPEPIPEAAYDSLARYQARKDALPIANESLAEILIDSNQLPTLQRVSDQYWYMPPPDGTEPYLGLKDFWERIEEGTFTEKKGIRCLEGAELMEFLDTDFRKQSVCVGAFLYVKKVETFSYSRDDKQQRANRIYVDSCGEDFLVMAWPGKHRTKISDSFEGGELIFALLSYKQQGKSPALEAAYVIKPPLLKKVAEEKEETTP